MTTHQQSPQPAGRYNFPPIVEKPKIIPSIVKGADAPRFVDDFNRLVDLDYNGNEKLKVVEIKKVGKEKVPIACGSSALALPLIQKLVYPKIIGAPEIFQRTLTDGNTIYQYSLSVNLGVVLDFSGSNHELAVDLFEQLPRKLRDLEGLPAVVIRCGLKNFDKGDYGVGLVYVDGTQVRPSKILEGGSGNFSNNDVSSETGLPTKLEGGERNLYTSIQKSPSKENLGISSLILDWSPYNFPDQVFSGEDPSISSCKADLSDSNVARRIVLFDSQAEKREEKIK